MKINRFVTSLAVVVMAAVLFVVAAAMGGMFDGHKTAGWTWDKHATAGTVIILRASGLTA